MNWSIYESMDRIPLGAAVTIEFAGPLLVAVIGSRRPLDVLWIVLAAAGIVLLADPGGGSMDTARRASSRSSPRGCWMAYICSRKRVGAGVPGRLGARARDGRRRAGRAARPGVIQGGGALLEPELLGSALVVALASSVLPYSLELEALRRLRRPSSGC